MEDKDKKRSRLEDKKRIIKVTPKSSIYLEDRPQDHRIHLKLILIGYKNTL